MKVTVLGAGNGGQALAGDLSYRGHDVVLYEDPQFGETIHALHRQGNRIKLTGELERTGQLVAATTEMDAAIAHAEVVFVVAPAFAQRPLLEPALTFLRDDQTVVLVPGNFGSLWLCDKLSRLGKGQNVVIGETDTLPYACRIAEPGEISVWGLKTYTGIGILPGALGEEVCPRLQAVFPVPLRLYSNVLQAGIANTNMILHCITMIMNAGRIESDDARFRFYTDGMTESVCTVMEAMDRERISVGSAYGLSLTTMYTDAMSTYEGATGETLHEALTCCEAYGCHGVDSPVTMEHRYLTEDVPYLLVPLTEFGRLAGVPTPVIESVIALAEVVAGKSYRGTGRTLDQMGLDGMSLDEVLARVTMEGRSSQPIGPTLTRS